MAALVLQHLWRIKVDGIVAMVVADVVAVKDKSERGERGGGDTERGGGGCGEGMRERGGGGCGEGKKEAEVVEWGLWGCGGGAGGSGAKPAC